MREVLLDPKAIGNSLRRIAGEIVERHGTEDLALVGIRRGGEPFAQRLAALIGEIEGAAPPIGAVDITLYRDDAATAWPNPRIGPTQIPFEIRDRRVVLVDDVISTGRTIRAAVDAVLDYGRPRQIELVAIVDRGGRELPIQPDYHARRIEVAAGLRVEFEFRDAAGQRTTPAAGEPWAVVVDPEGGSPPSLPPEQDPS
jgi:pyrimidine operon attenuation protein / uracil phosphoribosyltransferase